MYGVRSIHSNYLGIIRFDIDASLRTTTRTWEYHTIEYQIRDALEFMQRVDGAIIAEAARECDVPFGSKPLVQ